MEPPRRSDTCAVTATTSTFAPSRLARSKPSERAASEPLDPSVPTTIVAIGPSFRSPDQDVPGQTAHTLQRRRPSLNRDAGRSPSSWSGRTGHPSPKNGEIRRRSKAAALPTPPLEPGGRRRCCKMAVRVDARQVEVKDRPRDAMTGHVLLYAVAAAASPLVLTSTFVVLRSERPRRNGIPSASWRHEGHRTGAANFDPRSKTSG